MEVKELVSFYINETTNTMDITFRTIEDSEDEIRNDQIELNECKNFGHNFLETLPDSSLFESEDFEDNDLFGGLFSDEIDEQEIISFLNEYYLVYLDRLPSPDFF
jgi:hypothetical protein